MIYLIVTILREFVYAIGRELNPAHDLDRIRSDSQFKNWLMELINIPKHGVRGALYGTVVGAGVGTLVGMVYDGGIPLRAYSIAGAIIGMPIGGLLDCLQFIHRSSHKSDKLEMSDYGNI